MKNTSLLYSRTEFSGFRVQQDLAQGKNFGKTIGNALNQLTMSLICRQKMGLMELRDELKSKLKSRSQSKVKVEVKVESGFWKLEVGQILEEDNISR